MPIYEYYCDACEEKMEQIQKITEDPLDVCPKCGEKGKIHRLISNTSFKLKGTGWYVTDFAGKKPKSTMSPPIESDHSSNGNGNGNGSSEKSTSSETSAESKPSESKPTESKSDSSSGSKSSSASAS